MKPIILIVFALFILISCGPHRMKCGPGGGRRCVEITKTEPLEQISASAVSFNTNQKFIGLR